MEHLFGTGCGDTTSSKAFQLHYEAYPGGGVQILKWFPAVKVLWGNHSRNGAEVKEGEVQCCLSEEGHLS